MKNDQVYGALAASIESVLTGGQVPQAIQACLEKDRRSCLLTNFRGFLKLCKNCADRFDILCFFAPMINRWLDRTRIARSKRNLRMVRKIYRDFNSFADFNRIQPPYGGLSEVVKCYRRLKGLV